MTIHYQDKSVTLHHGDAEDVMREMPAGSVDCIVTSPPYYGLRDYGVDGQIGSEGSPADYVDRLAGVFSEAHRVLADDGTLWLNLGDSYASRGGPPGLKVHAREGRSRKQHDSGTRPHADRPAKSMLGIPWRVAMALQDTGWILRSEVIWVKPNAMPESVRDRPSGRHEHVFLLTKTDAYWFDLDPIREPHRSAPGREGAGALRGQRAIRPTGPNSGAYAPGGRNPGDVWTIATRPFPDAHFATFPVELPRRCIAAGCEPNGVVLDMFSGAGTTGLAAAQLGRRFVGIDINADYLDLSLRTRLAQASLIDTEGLS